MATILVIDDDPDVLLLVEAALGRGGHKVVTSSEPAQIASLAAEHGVDAVVLDVLMPEVSGHQALGALRDHPTTGGVPVLLLSAQAEGQDRVEGLRLGADDFLSKPFEPEELVLRIDRLVAQRSQAPGADEVVEAKLERAMRLGKVEGPLYLGRYQALEVVGEGGSGMVFRGWDPWLKRPVALKTMRFESLRQQAGERPARPYGDLSGSGQVADLLHEAVTVARFSHSNIVTVYDVGGGRDHAFLAMEFVHGTSLAAYLEQRGRLEPSQVIHLGQAIARGLQAAHDHHIVHHDVKPGNILLGHDGSIKVSDFGVAQLVTTLNPSEETIFGTPGYLPPELLMGETYSERGDLFGLGVVLYQCLTGEMPFAGKSFRQLVVSTVRSEAPSAKDHAPDLPDDLEALVRALLAKDPDQRPAHAAEVAERLRILAQGIGPWRFELADAERDATRKAFRAHATSRFVTRSEIAELPS